MAMRSEPRKDCLAGRPQAAAPSLSWSKASCLWAALAFAEVSADFQSPCLDAEDGPAWRSIA
jgi:hypothetical protein